MLVRLMARPFIATHTRAVKQSVPWNVEYVNTAYGPAIYSYERPWAESARNVLTIEIN